MIQKHSLNFQLTQAITADLSEATETRKCVPWSLAAMILHPTE